MTDETAALNRAWPMICHLISLAQLHLSNLSPNGKQRWILYPIARLAESMLRRWLVLSACQAAPWPDLDLVEQSPADRASLPPIRPAPRRVPGRVPCFRLAEPLPGFAAWMVTAATDAQDPVCCDQTPFNPARLRARIAALGAVMDAPNPHIQRMAKWLARAAARQKRAPCRTVPLGIGWPAGTSRAAKQRNPDRVSMVLYLGHLGRQAVIRCGSP